MVKARKNLLSLFIICLIGIGCQIAYQKYQTSVNAGEQSGPFFNPIRLRSSEPSSFPAYGNCANAREGTLEFDGRAIVLDEFAKKDPTGRKAAELQLKYMNGLFNSVVPDEDEPRLFVLPQTEFRVLKVSKTSYPNNLDFKFTNDDRRFYTESFLGEKKVHAGEKATAVDYHAKQRVLICGGPHEQNEFTLDLPHDPYLAYWLIPHDTWPERGLNGHKRAVNPCSHIQFVEMNMPSYYWYVWAPHLEDESADGLDYQCDELLKPGRDYAQIKAKFEEEKPKSISEEPFAAFAKTKPLKMSVIYGLISEQATKESFRQALKYLEDHGGALELANKLEKLPPAELSAQDPSIWSIAEFIRAFSDLASLRSLKVEDKGEYAIFHLDSNLRASGRDLKTDIYFGPTDDVQGKARHWPFLADALANSDMIYYIGHSGMGANMSLQVLRERLKMSEPDLSALLAKKPYQVLGIISCYSLTYFGDDYLAARTKAGTVSDLMLIGAGTYEYLVPVGLIFDIDETLANHHPSIAKALSMFVAGRDAVTLRRAKP